MPGPWVHTGFLELETPGHDDFEAGKSDTFRKVLNDLGTVTYACLWRNDAGLGDEWYVEHINITEFSTGLGFAAPFHQWIPEKQRVCKAASPN